MGDGADVAQVATPQSWQAISTREVFQDESVGRRTIHGPVTILFTDVEGSTAL